MRRKTSRCAPSGSRRNADGFRRSIRRTHGKSVWRREPPPSCVTKRKAAMNDPNLDELAQELAEFAEPEKNSGRPPREERIIAGFEEIQRFVEKNGHAPQHGEALDIFERLYAVRLDRLRALEECRSLLAALDCQGLLAITEVVAAAPVEAMDEDELLAEL